MPRASSHLRCVLLLLASTWHCSCFDVARALTPVSLDRRQHYGVRSAALQRDAGGRQGNPHGGHGEAIEEHLEDHFHSERSEDAHDTAEDSLDEATMHGGEPYHKSHGHEHNKGDGARATAIGLVFTSIMIPLVLYMVAGDGLIAELTIKMLDTFVSIFLAVLWFNAFAQFMLTFQVRRLFPYAEEVLYTAELVILYYMALFVAWKWRHDPAKLSVFCSVGAHAIAFAGIAGFGSTQRSLSEEDLWWEVHTDWEDDAAISFGFCVFVIVFLAMISFGTWFFWRRNYEEEEKMNEGVDDLELDILGLVLSFLITQAVRHALTGTYPPSHFLLQESERYQSYSDGHHHHEAWQRNFMLAWSLLLTVVTFFSLRPLAAFEERAGYWGTRAAHVAKVVLVMLVAWGYLLWGQWQFHDVYFHGDAMVGHMLFASMATFICLMILVAMAQFQEAHPTPSVARTNGVLVMGISLIAAWSWEHTFNLALNIVGHDYEVGYGGLMPKVLLAVLIPLVLMPIYVGHIKPRVLELQEETIQRHESSQASSISEQQDQKEGGSIP